jgi:hypothetical protein
MQEREMNKSFNVFISWSGERSHWVADALWEWLPLVIQCARPFLSDKGIKKGSRGLHEIGKALEGIRIGISCLTPENLREPWILYEAGALSKTIDDETRLCTYLLGGLNPEDVETPLGMFQATKADAEDTFRLISAINAAIGDDPVPEPRLRETFDAMWPKLEQKLASMPGPEEAVQAKRAPEDMIAEILDISRAEANRRKRTDSLDPFLPLFEEFVPILPQIREAVRGLKNRVLAAATPGPAQDAGAVSGSQVTGRAQTNE